MLVIVLRNDIFVDFDRMGRRTFYKEEVVSLNKDELISRVEKSLLKSCPIYEAKDTYVPLLVAIQAVERCFDLPIEDALLSWL